MSKKLMLAGGGTGGHILAGVAIAEVWKSKMGSDSSVLFVGALGGLEEKLVPRAGYPLHLLKIGSLNRVGLRKKVKTLFQLPLAFLHSARLLVRERPQLIIGVGGYSSGPVLLIARILIGIGLLKARTAILEQNSVPGMTNRILGKLVHFVFAAFPGTEQAFPGKKVVLTGNPIRSIMRPMSSANRDPFTIFIFGGSQGALGVNTLVLEALPYLRDLNSKLKWVHQTGEKDFDRVFKGHQKAGTQAQVEKFIFDMPSQYEKASLLICRAGSSTLAEIAAVGRASILIPLPTAADNHQEKNASIFVQAGAALLLRQNTSQGEDLANRIRDLVGRPDQIDQMEQKVTQFFKPRAAEDVIQALVSHPN